HMAKVLLDGGNIQPDDRLRVWKEVRKDLSEPMIDVAKKKFVDAVEGLEKDQRRKVVGDN
ncbi:hypothetical protein, partial [Streptococcus pneumoniae]|uniref:hypothetical protein n=1 Tax=Streptococcus pneumoniae TaxID=1313 RepID=UPI0018B0ADF0